MKNSLKQSISLGLTILLLVQWMVPSAMAADKTLRVEQAISFALNENPDVTKKYNEIILKKMKYVEAVEGARATVKNKSTFRWKLLFSFKFPEPLNMMDEFDLAITPLVIQTEIDTLEHALADLTYNITAQTKNLYIETYISQEKVTFTQTALNQTQKDLDRNKAGLLTGDATQADIEAIEKRIETLRKELANLKRGFENQKRDLSDLVHLDVTSNYRFTNPMQEMNLERSFLPAVVAHTLEEDQGYYEARAATSTAWLNLDGYETLMKNQYGQKMAPIQPFIDMAKQGQEVDYAAFQIKYKEFIKNIDKPWEWGFRILFFSFQKEWFKGEISGSRYIQDELYAVYTACMEYSNALRTEEATRKSLVKEVESTYESLVSTWNAYESLADLLVDQEETLDKIIILNKLGKAGYDEVELSLSTYQETQISALDTLGMYNTLLNDFDDLTCGAITQYLEGTGLTMDGKGGGDSVAELDVIEDPYYYLHTSVADLKFSVGVSIPEEFKPTISHFEVWSEGTQIGERASIDEEVSHLAIDYGGSNMLDFHFYDGENLVATQSVDANVPRDLLDIEEAEPEAEEPLILAIYSASTTAIGEMRTSEIKITPASHWNPTSYAIIYADQEVYSKEKIPIDEEFRYLSLLVTSLEQATVMFYDEDGRLLETGRFETSSGNILNIAQN